MHEVSEEEIDRLASALGYIAIEVGLVMNALRSIFQVFSTSPEYKPNMKLKTLSKIENFDQFDHDENRYEHVKLAAKASVGADSDLYKEVDDLIAIIKSRLKEYRHPMIHQIWDIFSPPEDNPHNVSFISKIGNESFPVESSEKLISSAVERCQKSIAAIHQCRIHAHEVYTKVVRWKAQENQTFLNDFFSKGP